MKTFPTIQSLMDEAYASWNENEYDSYEDMICSSDKNTQISVLCGNLNYQVENGGFRQWVSNGYALKSILLLDYLDEIGTPACKKVSDLIEQIMPYLDLSETSNKGCLGSYWKMTEDNDYEVCPECDGSGYGDDYDTECEYCCGSGEIDLEPQEDIPFFIDDLDDDFYKINEEFLHEVEEYISKNK